MRVYEAWEPSEFDIVAYEYELTDAGRANAEKLPDRLRAAAAELVGKVKSLGAWNQAALSMAAKLHHQRTIDSELPDASVAELAKQFGWRMTDRDASLGAKVLRALSLGPSNSVSRPTG